MSWQIKISKRAKKHRNLYARDLKKRIDCAFLDLLNYYNGKEVPKPDVKILAGKYQGLLRLRVGEFRIIFTMDIRDSVIFVIDILPRGKAYK